MMEAFAFRALVKAEKQLTHEDCAVLLTKETRGTLAVSGDNGYPYAMPMNHYYDPGEGCLYFHTGNIDGHRRDALRRSDKVCYCVCEQGVRDDGDWVYHVRSVIVFGRMEIIDDPVQIRRVTYALSRKFTEDDVYILGEIERYAHRTQLLRLVPEHICGKRVDES